MANYDVPKQRVKILTIDPSSRAVEGLLKDGAAIRIAVWNYPPFFRWPSQGEIWTIEFVGNNWLLGEYVAPGEKIVRSGIETLKEGEALVTVPSGNILFTSTLDAGGIRLESDGPMSFRSSTGDYGVISPAGKEFSIARKITYTLGLATPTTVYIINHELNTPDIIYSVRNIAAGAVMTAVAGVILDANRLQLTFTVAPALNSQSLTIIG